MHQSGLPTLIKNPDAVLVVTVIADAGLALGAFVLSFDALRELAVVAGVRPALAWIWPVIVDGFIVVATINAIVLSDRRAKTAWYPWAALLVFAMVSVAGNGLHAARHAHPDAIRVEIAAAVSAIPAIALLVISHLIVVMLMTRRDSAEVPASEAGRPAIAPAPVRATRSRDERPSSGPRLDDHDLLAWVRSQIAQGRRVTGTDVARQLEVSPATGRRRLQALRAIDPDLASLGH